MNKDLVQRLRKLEQQRSQVEELDSALSQLTPVEQVILRKLVIDWKREHGSQLSQLLGVEPVTVYRWKRRALKRLEAILCAASTDP